MTLRIPNRDMGKHVAHCSPFKGSHTWGEWIRDERNGDRYVAYSYGRHFPMYLYSGSCWYANRDKYSISTTRHQSQAHPRFVCLYVPTYLIRAMAERGVTRGSQAFFEQHLSTAQQEEYWRMRAVPVDEFTALIGAYDA